MNNNKKNFNFYYFLMISMFVVVRIMIHDEIRERFCKLFIHFQMSIRTFYTYTHIHTHILRCRFGFRVVRPTDIGSSLSFLSLKKNSNFNLTPKMDLNKVFRTKNVARVNSIFNENKTQL